jgi:hypothetical protein
MSIFSTILDKLGIHKPAAPAVPAVPVVPAAHTTTYEPGFSGSYGASTPTAPVAPVAPAAPKPPVAPYNPLSSLPPAPAVTSTPTPAAPVEMPMVDVVSHLDNLAKTNPVQGLNWKQSIHDLMFLLGLPHSADDIKALAVELGCPEKEMADSYSRNVWTYQTLMKKIAENGGNIPPALLK